MPNWETFRFELRYSGDRIKSELIAIEEYRWSLYKLILLPSTDRASFL